MTRRRPARGPMIGTSLFAAVLLGALVPAAARPVGSTSLPPATPPAIAATGPGGARYDVSLMTYNVHGLPWPIASERADDLHAIAARLAAMRAAGTQPHIVAVQEAFIADAKAIGPAAGYRYAAFGPDDDTADQAHAALPARDDDFVAEGSRLVGERLGKHVDSGLAIFSDYPILAVRRIAYPLCAGYDCLANKGALAALIAVPGLAQPIVVVDTHLNSNTASGAATPRAIYAYRRQLDLLAGFVATLGAADRAILVAGDFNVGHDLARRAQFDRRMLDGTAALQTVVATCRIAPRCPVAEPAGMAESIGRAKDWLLYRAPTTLAIRPVALAAPFGRDAEGAMLSDHVGIAVRYAITPLRAPVSPVGRMTLASR